MQAVACLTAMVIHCRNFAFLGSKKSLIFWGLIANLCEPYRTVLRSQAAKIARYIVGVEKDGAYITGHGAKDYLDHEIFEFSSIDGVYVNYLLRRYPQLLGNPTSHVSIINPVVNIGKKACHYATVKKTNCGEFVNESK
jgi:hypothetical protein